MKRNVFLLVLVVAISFSSVFTSCKKDKEPEDPEVSFDITNNYMKAPVTINFSNTSIANENDFKSFSWDFEDGSTSDVENPTHEYTTGGVYTVDLVITTTADKQFGTSKNVTVYGDIIAWEPDQITFYPENILSEGDTLDMYLVLRDASGQTIDYTSDGQYRIHNDVSADYGSIISGISNVQLGLSSGQITFELRQFTGPDYVYPDTDPLLYSATVKTSDVVPSNDKGPYYPYFSDSSDKFYLDIDWIEQ